MMQQIRLCLLTPRLLSQTSGIPAAELTEHERRPPHKKDENRLADQFPSRIYALYLHSRAVGIATISQRVISLSRMFKGRESSVNRIPCDPYQS